MKQIVGLICLVLFCLGVTWVEYQMVLRFRIMLILSAAVPILGGLLVTVVRASEGYERPDGFHVCGRVSRTRRVRGVRLAPRVRAAR
jgi:hypothetical protein